MRRNSVRWAVILGSALASSILARPATAELTLHWFTVDGGGHTYSTGGGLSLGGTAGQPDAGSAQSGTGLALHGGFWRGGTTTTSVPDLPSEPGDVLAFRVLAGFPNPFSRATHVSLELPEPYPVQVRVFDPSGRVVRSLCEETLAAGRHLLSWRGEDDSGRRSASGVYLLQVRAGSRRLERRVILLR